MRFYQRTSLLLRIVFTLSIASFKEVTAARWQEYTVGLRFLCSCGVTVLATITQKSTQVGIATFIAVVRLKAQICGIFIFVIFHFPFWSHFFSPCKSGRLFMSSYLFYLCSNGVVFIYKHIQICMVMKEGASQLSRW